MVTAGSDSSFTHSERSSSRRSSVTTIPRNFFLGVVNGILAFGSNALLDPALVISPFVLAYSGSRVLVGLVQAVHIIGWHWPQAVLPGWVEHRQRKLPIYVFAAVARGVGLTSLVVVTFFLERFSVPVGTLLFFLLYAAFVSSTGVAGIPFFDIVGKSIAPNRLGAFFGIRRVVGGVLAAVMGGLLYVLLSRSEWFPRNYALAFLVADVFLLMAVTCFRFVREPIHPVRSTPLGFRGFVRAGMGALRDDKAFQRLSLFRVFLMLGMMPFPFLAPCAVEILGARQAISGTFVTLFMITAIVANVVWGTMSDRYGNRLVLRCASLFCALVPILALAALLIPRTSDSGAGWPIFLMSAAVVGSSLLHTSFLMGSINYLLEIAPARSRPTYIGISQLLLLPSSLFPLLGGVVASMFSYEAVFVTALLASALLFWLVRRLPEPRHAIRQGPL